MCNWLRIYITSFMSFNYVNIYACKYISMKVLELASGIPYALG